MSAEPEKSSERSALEVLDLVEEPWSYQQQEVSMSWMDDVNARRLARESQESRRRLAQQQQSEEGYRPLTPEISQMVDRLLRELGEAFFGPGKFSIVSSTDRSGYWKLNGPHPGPNSSIYLAGSSVFWRVVYRKAGERVKRRILGLWEYRSYNWQPVFEVTHKGGSIYSTDTQSTATRDLSEGELKRVLKHAVSRGPFQEMSD